MYIGTGDNSRASWQLRRAPEPLMWATDGGMRVPNRKRSRRTWDNGSIEVPVGVPSDGADGEGCGAPGGVATARVLLSLVAVLVLLSLSPSLSFSAPPSRDFGSLALSGRPPAVSGLDNREDVLLANLEEGALELVVPRRGRRQLSNLCRPTTCEYAYLYWGAVTGTRVGAVSVSLPRRGSVFKLNLAYKIKESKPTRSATVRRISAEATRGVARERGKRLAVVRGGDARGIGKGGVFLPVHDQFLGLLLLLLLSAVGRRPEDGQYGRHVVCAAGLSVICGAAPARSLRRTSAADSVRCLGRLRVTPRGPTFY